MKLIKIGRKMIKAIIFFNKLISIDLNFSVWERQIKHANVHDIDAPRAEMIPIKMNNN